MNKDVKKLWLEALRSKEYTQGHETLRQKHKEKTSYCCLGVLCDLHAKHTGGGCWSNEHNAQYQADAYSSENFLPYPVILWAGMESRSPGFMRQGSYIGLAEINDGRKWNFNKIADVIDENF